MFDWESVWTILFLTTILVYGCLVVVVTFGGWQDIKEMFKQLDQKEDQKPK